MRDTDAPVTPYASAREERWLVVFLRLLGLVFLGAGVWHWQTVLGSPGFVPIAALDLPRQIMTGYLAVLCLVAGVGLWMATSWGTVTWLLAALSEIVLHVGFADMFGAAWEIVGFHLVTMALYVLLAWRVARMTDE